jgi:Flp pilus assembly protein CpaB
MRPVRIISLLVLAAAIGVAGGAPATPPGLL